MSHGRAADGDKVMTATPPGWYPDPAGPFGSRRYWDGASWTEHTNFVAYPPPQTIVAGINPALASYGRRLGGWLIDWVLVGVVSIPFIYLAGGVDHRVTTYTSNGAVSHTAFVGVEGWGVLVHGLLVVAYGTLFCGSRRGQTVGMMVTSVRAVDLAAGTPIGYARAFGRALLEYILALVLLIPWVIDMLFPLWDPKNQTLHDKATRTIVVVDSGPGGHAPG
jgi:uncharacterized RDD family membrane protein YckC